MSSSWHSYPQIFNLGHRYVADLLLDNVLVEEKIDGSQFSFGKFLVTPGGNSHDGTYETYIRCRSKGAEINVVAPEGMFKKAVDWVVANQHLLREGWTYRAEYLAKPKHNALAYDRVPANNIIIFDINTGEEEYLPYDAKQSEATRLGLEIVPQVFYGKIEDVQQFRAMLDTVSCLGGQKVEGVVIKNYHRYGLDKKVLLGKFVSEAFKETHSKEWKATNPRQGDILEQLIATLRTPARWSKAVQHLREAGKLEDSPKDIGLLMKEVPTDIAKEETEFIKDKLFEWAWPHIKRGTSSGLPEWYKEQLLLKQFTVEVTDESSVGVSNPGT
jgi:hypothetical protein